MLGKCPGKCQFLLAPWQIRRNELVNVGVNFKILGDVNSGCDRQQSGEYDDDPCVSCAEIVKASEQVYVVRTFRTLGLAI
jgi:hypothetical protein